jgi:hypothetical protein
MTRPLKIEYPGAVYHITSRGNAWQGIFLDDDIGLRSLRSFTRTYREHGYTMKKIADYLGILERRGRELAVGVASEKEQGLLLAPRRRLLSNPAQPLHSI